VRLPWTRHEDPYWDAFIHRPPADPNNLLPHAFKQARGGGVNPARTEVHSPNVMAEHVKELGRFYGAERVGIVERTQDPPFAIVCVLKADHDTRTARGIGGQVPALKGLFATFTLAAYIRELGYRAECVELPDAEGLALAAGLLPLPRMPHPHVGDVILTDLPLKPDGRAA
jgi:hypothetical protein